MARGQGVFRFNDLERFGTRCTLFPTFDTYHLPEGKTRMVRRIRHFKMDGSVAIEIETYHERNKERHREKQRVPLKEIYPDIKHVYNQHGQLIARRVIRDKSIQWVSK
ncbi:hypothetical protein [Enterococcus sp. DIV1420a]|uniref:hypothetical protein n=1 Tax=Enterococcus sp. DIV1420a TaxID=2774672 RepID=UPI003F278DF8